MTKSYHEIRVRKIPSVNRYVRHGGGRHYKPPEVVSFETAVISQLPAFLECDQQGKDISLEIIFVLNKNKYRRDLDNMPKVFIDCLAKRYGFNDSYICELHTWKRLDKTLDHEKILWRFG
jgi:Holliday junction resolvase RusA-like endonuclease